jgi:pyrrolidone-carboxylate peptidase
MKLALVLFMFSAAAVAKPLVLVGYFDAFGNAPFNNSEKIAKRLADAMKDHPELEIRLCALRTVFDKSFYQLEDCLKALPEAPKLVLGLGESNCNLKVETIARNNDKTKGPDNDGIERNNLVINPEAPKEIGFNYPLASMYCSLTEENRKDIEVSNNAGSFVCNNLAYQFAHNYPDTEFGFIHVPLNNCRNLDAKTSFAVKNIEQMIPAAIRSKDIKRLLTKKKDLEQLRTSVKGDKCLSEFYKRTKGVDEKSFWQFSVLK